MANLIYFPVSPKYDPKLNMGTGCELQEIVETIRTDTLNPTMDRMLYKP